MGENAAAQITARSTEVDASGPTEGVMIDEGTKKAEGDVGADAEAGIRMTRVVADEEDEEDEDDIEDHERPLLLPSALRSSLRNPPGSPRTLRSSSSSTRSCHPQQVLFGTNVGGGTTAADSTGGAGRKKPHRFPLILPFRNHSNGVENKKAQNGPRRGGGEKHRSWSFGTGDDGDGDDDDPVMALFRARASHRVRFCLEQQQQKQHQDRDQGRSKSPPLRSRSAKRDRGTRGGSLRRRSDTGGSHPAGNVGESRASSSSSRSLKQFMKAALFGGGPNRQNGGYNAASLAELEAQVARIQNEEEEDDEFIGEVEDGTAPLTETGGNSGVSGSLSSGDASVTMLSTPCVDSTAGEERISLGQTSPPSSPKAASSSPSTPHLSGRWSQTRKGGKKTFLSPKRSAATAVCGASSTFAEQGEVRSQVNVLLNKANRAHHMHFRYEYAIKCCMKALDLLKRAKYPEDHPTVLKTIQYLNTAHHALSSLENSANIVKMGIKYEDAGDWVRALKMYTIAYRIRRDNLSRSHPSLIVLLNMLGGVQLKRDEFEEAMEIFELALKDDFRLPANGDIRDEDLHGDDDSDDRPGGEKHVHEHKEADVSPVPKRARSWGSPKTANERCGASNLLAKSVAYREMGSIYERWGEMDTALQMYHKSLDCIADYKNISWEPPSLTVIPNHRLMSISPTSNKQDVRETSPPLGSIPLVSPSTGACGPSTSGSSPTEPGTPESPTSGPTQSVTNTESTPDDDEDDVNNTTITSCRMSVATEQDILLDLESVQLSRSFIRHATVAKSHKEDDGQFESGMECFLGECGDSTGGSRVGGRAAASSAPLVSSSCYDVFFQDNGDDRGSGRRSRKSHRKKDASTANVDIALTLHQIGQLYRAEGEYDWALAAYAVSLRGMKQELGTNHPNVASIMGNIGNLQKEMGDLNSAYETYQQVLAIESYRLGLSHPDVAITLHNIATIDAARGNNQNALTLYEQVLSLQRKLFGEGHMSLAVTASCMGDVYERIGDVEKAIDAFDEALRIKSSALGRHSVEVARLLHKLGKLSAQSGNIQLADSYLSRTVLIYRLNKMHEDDPWMIEVNRDVADIDALIAMGRADDMFEC